MTSDKPQTLQVLNKCLYAGSSARTVADLALYPGVVAVNRLGAMTVEWHTSSISDQEKV